MPFIFQPRWAILLCLAVFATPGISAPVSDDMAAAAGAASFAAPSPNTIRPAVANSKGIVITNRCLYHSPSAGSIARYNCLVRASTNMSAVFAAQAR